jgi:hypothetical protein
VSPKEKTITVTTPQAQNMSLLPNTQVAIHCDLFPHPVLTNVLAVDTRKKNAVLHPFEFIRGMNDNRTHVRVQTKGTIFVSINSDDDHQFSAQIHDISTDGLSVVFEEISNEIEEVLQAGKLSRISYKLQISSNPVPHTFSFPAQTVYLTLLNDGKCRIGFQTFPTPRDIVALRRYIFDRQTELFQEISSPTTR